MLISPRVLRLVRKLFVTWSRPPSASKRILVHGMNYAPEFIGVGKYTTELAQFLAERQYDVDVVAALPHYPGWRVRSARPWHYTVCVEHGVRITRCPLLSRPGGRVWRLIAPVSFAALAAPIVLWRCLRDRPATVLCVEPTLFAMPAALLGAWMAGARTVLHVQDLEIDAAFATGYLGSRALRRATHVCERALLRRLDMVVTISDAMAARLRARGVAPDRLRVLRNWIGADDLGSGSVASWLPARLGLAAGTKLVLYAGNLGAKQGLPVLIEAARHLRTEPRIRFVVAGDGPMLPTLRAAAASLPNLDVLPLLPRPAFLELLRAADLHVLPQHRAAADLVFPSKLGPMLASGRPVIVTADRGSELGRWLGSAAILSPPGDGRALAAAIAAGVAGRAAWNAQRAAHLATTLQAAAILPAFAQCLLPPARTAPSDEPARHVAEPLAALVPSA